MHCYHGKKSFRNRTITITRFIHSRRQRSIKISRTQRQLLKRRRKLPPKQQQKLRPRKQRLQSHLLRGTLQVSRESQHLLHSNKGYGIPTSRAATGSFSLLDQAGQRFAPAGNFTLSGAVLSAARSFFIKRVLTRPASRG